MELKQNPSHSPSIAIAFERGYNCDSRSARGVIKPIQKATDMAANPKPGNPKPPTPAQLAMQMRARRTKRMMMYNLGLLGVLIVLVLAYFGYTHLHRTGNAASAAADTADTQAPIDPGNPSPAPVEDTPAGLTPRPSTPVKPVSQKFIFICDTAPGLQSRMAAALPLSAFSKVHQMDVIVLGSDGAFTSVTGGLVPITDVAKKSAVDAVAHASAGTGRSFMPALKAAAAENPDAVYLVTTADQIKQFGADPLATLRQAGTIPVVNCMILTTPTDSPADLAAFKKLAKGMHGDVYNAR